ncbi:MAG TPA: patatin-like phospholipase family protein [Candidatus Limnocylindria bacterium]|nr:patatin-like phospholipase family protein [Candidatus Limnocylindria bacterium]
MLSGGGARGAFQVGVYERMLEDERFARGPAVLSGTSAGAINAALIAAGRTPSEMLDFWLGIAADPPVRASAAFFDGVMRAVARLAVEEGIRWLTSPEAVLGLLRRLRHHLRPRRGTALALLVEYVLTERFELVSRFLEMIREPYLAETARLRARLVDALGGERVPSRGHRLAINTVDARTGQVVRFITAPAPVARTPDYVVVDAVTVDMVLASASIPLLFPAVPIGERLLWDGGLLVNTPLAPVIALGADEIVTVLVTEPPDRDLGPLPHFGRAVERSVDSFLENAYNVDRKLLHERNRVARLRGATYRDVRLYEAVRPARGSVFSSGSYLYFERSVIRGMYQAGRQAGAAWLAAGPCLDHLEEPAFAAVLPGG